MWPFFAHNKTGQQISFFFFGIWVFKYNAKSFFQDFFSGRFESDIGCFPDYGGVGDQTIIIKYRNETARNDVVHLLLVVLQIILNSRRDNRVVIGYFFVVEDLGRFLDLFFQKRLRQGSIIGQILQNTGHFWIDVAR